MRVLWMLAILGAIASAVFGAAYIRISGNIVVWPPLLFELFKASLTLTVVTVGGAALKAGVDRFLDEQRARRSATDQRNQRRESIMREFVEVYSQFYSIRKLWHSVVSKDCTVYSADTPDYYNLVRQLLQRSVDLEGRFGALKVLAIASFGLPSGDFGTKKQDQLEAELSNCQDPRDCARLRLDLLGEAYDDWRHALEQERKIRPGRKLWENYESLLEFFLLIDEDVQRGECSGRATTWLVKRCRAKCDSVAFRAPLIRNVRRRNLPAG